MLWLFLSVPAQADTFTLDNGTMLSGILAEYNLRGSCQISVNDGPLTGAIVTVPCDRIARFERDESSPLHAAEVVQVTPEPVPTPPVANAAPLITPIVEEVVAVPSEPAPLEQPVDAPFAEEAYTHTVPHAAPPEPVVQAAEPEPDKEVPTGTGKDERKDALWSEASATAEAPVTAEAGVARPSIGSVVLPALPNLRINRHTAEESE